MPVQFMALAMLCAASLAEGAEPLVNVATLMPVAAREPSGAPQEGAPADIPSPEELQKRHAAIGSVAIDVEDIFDEDDPRENALPYRLANDLKIATRDTTIREQLLFGPGDQYSAQKAEETARLLRERNYLADAEVTPTAYDPGTNTVDMKVRVRDVWTLEPGVGFGRSGGANSSRIRVADEDLLGFGQEVALEYKSDPDRSGLSLQFHDPNLRHSRWGLDAKVADNSDGTVATMALERPFYSLDSRWSAGLAGGSDRQATTLYDLGEKVDEFNSDYTSLAIQAGTSNGLVNGWARRWLAGYRYDKAHFGYASGGDAPSTGIPEDRLLSYPWVGFEFVEDHYSTTHNHDQIGRTEDVFLGHRFNGSLGWATQALGSDRSAGVFSLGADYGRPFGERDTVQLGANWSGRYESGATSDSLLEAGARYYHAFDESNLFLAAVEGAHAHALDEDRQLQLGGDNGLRGYPLRYQNGTSRALITAEERYFTDWYPFRLFRVGGAVFGDMGRTWGQAPFSSEPLGWLGDVGVGLRLGNARSGIGNVLHVDLAFPVASTADVDSMQVLIQAQKTF